MRCIVDIALATTRVGSTLRQFRRQPDRTRPSKTARGAAEIRREFEPQAGEIVALVHWGSSGFANTDLDLQLERHGIHQLIVMGLIAHTCVEATVRYAAELGYKAMMVQRRDGELLG
jgi:nicotinamidase-related amidase